MRGNPRDIDDNEIEENLDNREMDFNEDDLEFHSGRKRVDKRANLSLITLMFSGATILLVIVCVASIAIYNQHQGMDKQATAKVSTTNNRKNSVSDKKSTKSSKLSSDKKKSSEVNASKVKTKTEVPSSTTSQSAVNTTTTNSQQSNVSDTTLSVSNSEQTVSSATPEESSTQSNYEDNTSYIVTPSASTKSSITKSTATPSSTTYKEIKLDQFVGKDAREVTKKLTAMGATVVWKDGNKIGAKQYEILEVLGEGSKATLTIQN